VSSNVLVAEATRDEVVLPERVQEALGELVGAAKEGLLALSGRTLAVGAAPSGWPDAQIWRDVWATV